MPIRTPEEGAALARKRWDKPRPAPADGRRRAFPAGSDEERLMELRAAEIGLQRGGESITAWRRRLYRLAADEAAQISSTSAAAADTDDLLIAHLEAEVVRLRDRAARDRQIAAEHDRQADDAETALVAALRRQGRAS